MLNSDVEVLRLALLISVRQICPSQYHRTSFAGSLSPRIVDEAGVDLSVFLIEDTMSSRTCRLLEKVTKSRICRPRRDRLGSFDEIVLDYVTRFRRSAHSEMQFYARQRSLKDVIWVATLAITPDGKKHPHQYRIPGSVLEQARQRLLCANLQKCATFEDLHLAIEAAIKKIHGIGDLVVYDTSKRIGAFLRLEPERIYLHAGTRTGARHLGLDTRRKMISRSEQLDLPARLPADGILESAYRRSLLDHGPRSQHGGPCRLLARQPAA